MARFIPLVVGGVHVLLLLEAKLLLLTGVDVKGADSAVAVGEE